MPGSYGLTVRRGGICTYSLFHRNVFFDIVEDCTFVVVYVRINKINNVIREITGDIPIK